MWIYDPVSLKFISVNDAAVTTYGYTKREFLNLTIKAIRNGDNDAGNVVNAIKDEGKFQKSGIWTHVKKDGSLIFVDISSQRIKFLKKDAVMILAHDCTEKIMNDDKLKQLNLTLANEKKRLSDIQELSKIAGWDYYIVDNKLVLSDEMFNIFNLDKSKVEVSYVRFLKTVYKDDRELFLKAAKITIDEGRDLDVVHRFYLGKNDIRYIRELGKLEYINGIPFKVRGTMQDITELKRIEHEKDLINNENKKLGNIITKINNMVLIQDTENRITWVNKAFEDFTGYALEEVQGLNPASFLIATENAPEVTIIKQAIEKREAFSAEIINYSKTKQPYWVNIEFTPLFDDGQFTGYISVHNNVTARKEKEGEITKQNIILRDIAWLSSHELRRPAASIMGLMGLIKDTDDVAEKDEYLSLLDECTTQLDHIIHKIHDTINEKLPGVK